MGWHVQVRWFVEGGRIIIARTRWQILLLSRLKLTANLTCSTVLHAIVKGLIEWGCRFDSQGQRGLLVALMCIANFTCQTGHNFLDVSWFWIRVHWNFTSCLHATTALWPIPVPASSWVFVNTLLKGLGSCVRLSLVQVLLDPFCRFFVNLQALRPIMPHFLPALRVMNCCLLQSFHPLLSNWACSLACWGIQAVTYLLLNIDLESIKWRRKISGNRLVTHGRAGRIHRLLILAIVNRCILAQRAFEVFLIASERVWAFLDSEPAIVGHDVSVSSRAILAVNNHVRFDIVSDCLVNAHRVECSWVACHIGRWRCHLMSCLVTNCKSSVVVCDICITIISTLAETFLEPVPLVD